MDKNTAIMTMRQLIDINRSKREIFEDRIKLENTKIRDVRIKFVSKYGDDPCLEIACMYRTIHGVLYTREWKTLGWKLREIVRCLLEVEDDTLLQDLKETPIRLAIHDGELIGFGHFIEDKWLSEEILHSWAMRKMKGEL